MKKTKNALGIIAGISLMLVFYLCAGSEEWTPLAYALVAIAVLLIVIIGLTSQTPD